MSTTPPPRCPACSAEIPPGAPQGLCPKCLLQGVASLVEGTPIGGTGNSSSVGTSGEDSARQANQRRADSTVRRPEPPSIEELAVAFPQLEILALIGRGGMGYVYKARQTKLDRLVALKILPGHLADEPSFHERFEREARVLAKLQHPLIVGVYDFGDVNVGAGPIFFLMLEYVDGVNLREAMRAGRFTPEQALAIVPQVCDALQYAHSKGVLHRDIKPENILLDTEGRVKIADFGIAKVLDPNLDRPDSSPYQGKVSESEMAVTRLTATGSVLGTPLYMAPEQLISPNAVDHRADIYSLGVVFYEMLTGELPMGRFAPPSAKSLSDRQIDLRVDEIVMRALAKERELRQQSAREMKTEVETVSATRGPARSSNPAFETRATPPEHAPPGLGRELGKTLMALLVIGFLGVAIPAIAFAVVAPIVFVNAIIFGIATNELGSTVPAFVICAVFDLILISAIWRIWLKDFSPRRAGAFLRRLIHPDDQPSGRRRVEDPERQPTQRQNSGLGGWLALGALLVGSVLCVLPMISVRTETRRDAETVAVRPAVAMMFLAVGLTVAGAVVPIVLGWRHLLRLRHDQRREGMIPALIASWFLPLILLDVLTVYLIFQPLEPLRYKVASHDYTAWTILIRYLAGLVCLMVDGALVAATWCWVTQTSLAGPPGRSGSSSGAPSILRRVSGAVLILFACVYLCEWYSYVGMVNQVQKKVLKERQLQIEQQFRNCQAEVESLSLQLMVPQTEAVAKKLADSVRSRFVEIRELEREREEFASESALDGFERFLPYALVAVPLIAAGCGMLASSYRMAWCVGSAVTSLALVFLMSRTLTERLQFRDQGISFTRREASAIDKLRIKNDRAGGLPTRSVPDQTQSPKHEFATSAPPHPGRDSLLTDDQITQAEAKSLLDKAQRAIIRQDWETLLTYLTDDGRDEWVFEIIGGCETAYAMLRAQSNPAALRTNSSAAILAQLLEALKKLRRPPASDVANLLQKRFENYPRLSVAEKRQFRIDVQRANYPEPLRVAITALSFVQQIDPKTLIVDLSTVEDLKVDADSATGSWFKENGERSPIVLRRTTDGWKIDSLIGKSVFDPPFLALFTPIVDESESVPEDLPADALLPMNDAPVKVR